MYNILVTGAAGQLGKSIFDCTEAYRKYTFYFATRKELDICDIHAVSRYCKLHAINVIINCAGYTNVDQAESEVEKAFKINEKGAENMAIVAKELSCKLMHISTDYVFEGDATRPYKEDDVNNPITVYGKSKLAGEVLIKKINPKNSVIVRTSWLYSQYAANFFKTMLRLGKEKTEFSVVNDQRGCPTYAVDLANALLKMIPNIMCGQVKTYHFSNEHTTTWYLFAKRIINAVYKNVQVNPIPSSAFFTKAKRPVYSVLDCTRIKKDYGLTIRTWEAALESCLGSVFDAGENRNIENRK
ncbi:MAG: dTDP-4-dehydrorhamnose reductase [Flavobacteriaceae bacterium]|nr:MAG: dTDP-4-dehydrorhamnose reductase [Flavobacteriaceae bacterium]